MSSALLSCCLFFLALSPVFISAMTDEQIAKFHQIVEKFAMECIKDNPITEDDITSLRAKKVPSGENVPCFLSCMQKKMGFMDNNGNVSNENALDLAKMVFSEPENHKVLEDYIHSCKHVNTEAVGDGTKGCERAMKAHKCMLENRLQIGLDI